MEEFLTEVEYNRLSETLDVLCSNLSESELKFIKTNTTNHLGKCLQNEIKDGRDLAIVLRRYGICDETNIENVRTALKQLKRYDLLRLAWCHERKSLKVNLLEEFLHQENRQREKRAFEVSVLEHEQQQQQQTNNVCQRRLRSSEKDQNNADDVNHPQRKKRRSNAASSSISDSSPIQSEQPQPNDYNDNNRPTEPDHFASFDQTSSNTNSDSEIKSRYTCDVRLRVWAEYCNHERHLSDNVFSNKEDPFERRLERFSQASSIIQSRELGYIVCDIKFSEITYLDAFWRDYLNGSLLEALKGVFITESLKQAVGNEPIKLLVSVDEEDYEEGRHILLGNVYSDSGQEMPPFY